jgi:hypothetical protein
MHCPPQYTTRKGPKRYTEREMATQRAYPTARLVDGQKEEVPLFGLLITAAEEEEGGGRGGINGLCCVRVHHHHHQAASGGWPSCSPCPRQPGSAPL